MKPKPLSIQHRFLLLQAGTFALSIWFLAGAIYISLKIRGDLAEPLRDLHAVIALNAEFNRVQDELMMAGARAYWHPDEGSQAELRAAARRCSDLRERYLKLSFSVEERRALERVRELQTRLVEDIHRNPVTDLRPDEALAQFLALGRVNEQIDRLLQNITRAHLERLDTSSAQLQEYTRMLYLLLSGFGLFAVFALRQFRRVQRNDIWGPLEELRRMVAEIRRGNLNLTGTVPRSIEFGPLVKGFLKMAGELREMRDSLEHKVAERTAKLEATQKELVQAAKLSSLGQLVSGVAHELNNPLTSILGFSEVGLMRKDLDAALRHQLQTIRSEALRLKNLVANLSSFARRAPQLMARLDLRRVLDRIVDLRRYQLSAGNIQLHYDRPILPVWTQGDADQLTQVFFNLVLNSEQAIKECRNQGDIWLACGAEAEGVWGSVRDNGAGMSPAIQERIFDPFFTTKPVGQGTGLGLSISHGIIEQHHGKITLEGAEGQGTTIRISLPAGGPAVEVPAATREKPVAAEAREARGQRALVIDDEPGITQLLEHYLKGHGWDCVVLNDATALESHLADQRFDVVICDLKMPGRNGLEVLRLLRQQRPELARGFVLITGNLAQGAEKEIVELAGVPVLRKPFTIAQLAETLRALLPENDEPEKG